MPFDQQLLSPHPETAADNGAGVASLHAAFIADERPAYLGLYTGARCELPGGEVVALRHRRTPLYDLARELEVRGYGAAHLQSFTPTGTPSLRGLVKVMAGLTVEEGPYCLRHRKYKGGRWCESGADARKAPRGTGSTGEVLGALP